MEVYVITCLNTEEMMSILSMENLEPPKYTKMLDAGTYFTVARTVVSREYHLDAIGVTKRIVIYIPSDLSSCWKRSTIAHEYVHAFFAFIPTPFTPAIGWWYRFSGWGLAEEMVAMFVEHVVACAVWCRKGVAFVYGKMRPEMSKNKSRR